MVYREKLIGSVKNFKLLLIKGNFEKDWRFYIEKTLLEIMLFFPEIYHDMLFWETDMVEKTV